jgi:hypothetical protein
MPLDPPHGTDLRSMVREVLREALGHRNPAPANGVEHVTIASDADLANFVRLLIARLDNPATAAAIRNGQHVFRLNQTAGLQPHAEVRVGGAGEPRSMATGQTISGVITEQKIDKLAGAGTLYLAPGAVLTPLARDRARKLGLKIERSR